MDAQRALLDELMGSGARRFPNPRSAHVDFTALNLTEEETREHKEVRWNDPDVCGPFMVRSCPHDLFVNTKSNLGPCLSIHDPKLKESFEKSPRHASYMQRFEAELAQQCEKLVRAHEVAISELNNMPPSRPVYQKTGNLFFRKSIKWVVTAEQKQLDLARDKLNKVDEA